MVGKEGEKGGKERRAFWIKTAFVLGAMATYKAATGFTALAIPLVLLETPAIDPKDEAGFNFWVSLQVFALYCGETVGEMLTGTFTDYYPRSLKKMFISVLLLAGAGYIGQGVAVATLLNQPLEIVMSATTVIRFFNGFFSPAVLGSLASFQLVERQLEEEGSQDESNELRNQVENLRPVALYLGDVAGCIFVGLAGVMDLSYLFYIIAFSFFLVFLSIFTLPDPIYSGEAIFSEGGGDDIKEKPFEEVDPESEPLLLKAAQFSQPVEGPTWWLFKYYVWIRAVIYIFLANMMNSLFNSIVGSDQVVLLGMSELLLSAENIAGSLLGVAVAWAFMTYLFKKLGSTKSLLLISALSFACVVGMPWFITSIPLSVIISIVYTPLIITQDAVAIISGATFATRTIANSEGFAYGFLNGASMIACGVAPFLYTALLSFLPKQVVWFVLASIFVVMMFAEFFNQLFRKCRKSSDLVPARPLRFPAGSVNHESDHSSSREPSLSAGKTSPFFPEITITTESDPPPPITRQRSNSDFAVGSKQSGGYLAVEAGLTRPRSKTGGSVKSQKSARSRAISSATNNELVFASAFMKDDSMSI